MKKIVSLFLILSGVTNLYAQTNEFKNALNTYSLDLYNLMKIEDCNLIISPLSIYTALLMAYEGAYGDTKNEFLTTLNITEPESLNNFNEFTKKLITCRDSSNKMKIANAIWVQNDLKYDKTFKDRINNRYSANFKLVDFAKSQATISAINSWVSQATNECIKNIISNEEINEQSKLIISNAIYFSGTWKDEFDKDYTKSANFYSISGDTSRVDFMHKTEYLGYYENSEFQVLRKPYKNYDKSFCIILPKKCNTLNELEKLLNNKLLNSILRKLTYPKVKLSMPKFKLETNYSLEKSLKAMGLKLAFSSQADFSGITKDELLMIDKVIHKTYIEINEVKTEAAAVTSLGMDVTASGIEEPKPKVFNANHPFIFLILDNETDGIVFMGRYVQA